MSNGSVFGRFRPPAHTQTWAAACLTNTFAEHVPLNGREATFTTWFCSFFKNRQTVSPSVSDQTLWIRFRLSFLYCDNGASITAKIPKVKARWKCREDVSPSILTLCHCGGVLALQVSPPSCLYVTTMRSSGAGAMGRVLWLMKQSVGSVIQQIALLRMWSVCTSVWGLRVRWRRIQTKSSILV